MEGPALKFHELVNEYLISKSEKVLDNLESSFISNLQDLKGLDPKKELVQHQTLVSLYKLFSSVRDSQLNWRIVLLLERACEILAWDSSSLLVFGKFVPELVKLLPVISNQKKLRVLNLLQILTYGAKVDVLMAYLSETMDALITIILKQDLEMLLAALQILINILNNNEVAIFMLSNHSDCKSLMYHILKMEIDSSVKMEACILAIIMRSVCKSDNDSIEDQIFIESTFNTVKTASGEMLSRTVDFFMKFIQRSCVNIDVSKFELCNHVRECLYLVMEKNVTKSKDVSAYFKFFKALVKMDCADLYNLYPDILKAAQKYTVLKNFKCTEPLELCGMIISDVEKGHLPNELHSSINVVVNELLSQLLCQIFSTEEHSSFQSKKEYNLYQLSLLQLFSIATYSSNILDIVISNSNMQDLVSSFVKIFLEDRSAKSSSLETQVCVKFLSLLSCLAVHETAWLRTGQNLLLDVRTVSLLASALKNGDVTLIANVLSIITSAMFPTERIDILAKHLEDPYSDHSNFDGIANGHSSSSSLDWSLSKSKSENVSKTKAIELYERKVELLTETEALLRTELSHAALSIHTLKQELSVSNQLRYALKEELSSHEAALKQAHEAYIRSQHTLKTQEQKATELSSSLEMELNRLKDVLLSLEQDFNDKKKKNEDLQKTVNELQAESTKRKQQLMEAQTENEEQRTQISSLKMHQSELLEKMREEELTLKKLNEKINELKIEKQEFEEETKKLASKLQILEDENTQKEKDLVELRRIRDTVYQIAGGNKRC